MIEIEPIGADERNMDGIDYFLLWAGAAVSLAEIWAGGLLAPLGFVMGIVVLVLGHVIGNFPLALGGIIGSETGLPTMVGVRPSFGIVGSYFAAALNVLQLVGWTAVMIWIGALAAVSIPGMEEALGVRWWIVILGAVTTVWATVGHRFWKWLQRIAVTLLILLCIVMTYAVLREYGLGALASARPEGELGFMLGLDLVIAMPISWLPLVSDYSRYSKKTASCFWGTWWGYFIVGSWMYFLGLAAAIATGSASPEKMILGMMSKFGMAVPALFVVMFSTFTTTFLDIFSTSVSARNILPRIPEKAGTVVAGILGLVVALWFTVIGEERVYIYENFLLFIGAMFCPLFGVVLADFFFIKKRRYQPVEMFRKGIYWFTGGFNIYAFIAWAAGFAIYKIAEKLTWPVGSSIPSILLAALIYLVLMQSKKQQEQA